MERLSPTAIGSIGASKAKMKMIDISRKPSLHREASAVGRIRLKQETLNRIRKGQIEKGNPAQLAILTGIQGAKLAPTLMPLCHPLRLEKVDVKALIVRDGIEVSATVVSEGKTGVEMEALSAVTTALLNVWDVTKQYEKDPEGQYPSTEITRIRVVRKVKRASLVP